MPGRMKLTKGKLRIDGKMENPEDLHESAQDSLKEAEQLTEYGEKYQSDMEVLEAEITKIEESSLSASDKVEVLRYMREIVVKTQEEYETEVDEFRQEQFEDVQETMNVMESRVSELDRTAEELSGVSLDAGSSDFSDAIAEVEAKREVYERYHTLTKEELRSRMEQAQRQMRSIRSHME